MPYWNGTFPSIDRYGRSIIFASTWDDPKSPVEAYRCDLPEGWYEKLMGAERAAKLRKRTAEVLGMSVGELVGR